MANYRFPFFSNLFEYLRFEISNVTLKSNKSKVISESHLSKLGLISSMNSWWEERVILDLKKITETIKSD